MDPPSSAGQATQPDVHAFHVPAGCIMQCMQCRRGLQGLGHRSFGECPEYRALSRDTRVRTPSCSCCVAKLSGWPTRAVCCRTSSMTSTSTRYTTGAATPAATGSTRERPCQPAALAPSPDICPGKPAAARLACLVHDAVRVVQGDALPQAAPAEQGGALGRPAGQPQAP